MIPNIVEGDPVAAEADFFYRCVVFPSIMNVLGQPTALVCSQRQWRYRDESDARVRRRNDQEVRRCRHGRGIHIEARGAEWQSRRQLV